MTFPSIYPWEPVQKIPQSPHLAHMQMPIHLIHHSKESAIAFLEHSGYVVKGIRIIKRWLYITILAMKPQAEDNPMDRPSCAEKREEKVT